MKIFSLIFIFIQICEGIKINVKQRVSEPSINQRILEEDKNLLQTLGGNSLFNQISGYETTGGVIGKFFSYISDKVEKLSGMNDFDNDSLVQNLAACRKFYDD